MRNGDSMWIPPGIAHGYGRDKLLKLKLLGRHAGPLTFSAFSVLFSTFFVAALTWGWNLA